MSIGGRGERRRERRGEMKENGRGEERGRKGGDGI